MEDLLIFPYSGTAIEAIDCLGESFKCIGFISDDTSVIGTDRFGIRIYGREAIDRFPDAKILAVPGSPKSYLKRKEVIDGLMLDENRFATIIHANAMISRNAIVGKNVLLMSGVVVTSNAVVGNHVCMLPNSVLHHDSILGEYTLVGANVTIAGNVKIGSNCYLGASSSIINGIEIGERSLIGIGSNVIKPCHADSRMVGNPAKNINS